MRRVRGYVLAPCANQGSHAVVVAVGDAQQRSLLGQFAKLTRRLGIDVSQIAGSHDPWVGGSECGRKLPHAAESTTGIGS